MNLRESCLPPGWYPQKPDEIRQFLAIDARDTASGTTAGTAQAAIAPHAGWYYSGKIAARAMASLNRNIETLVVIGGHLPAGRPPLFAMEDAVSTPLGAMTINTALRAVLYQTLGGAEDRFPDNTVEVLLPMARFFFPNASLLWLRLPASPASFDAGKAIAAASAGLQQTTAVLASADLTHYGPHYRFTPKGTGAEALRWVQEVNDRRFIDAVQSGNPAAVLERDETDNSCCSTGAVLGAMGFAAALNAGPARLLEYGTSAGKSGTEIPDSFVGYAAITF
ncbi:MAG: AmmeMemoRadiSam system protein B [Treponema sp.]|nr:AmmeMemoRadiSam system protein B [Treponema sp.]